MPFNFTPEEYVDMLLIFGECQKSSRAAAKLYRERFPDRRQPAHNTFRSVEQKMRTGSFPNSKHSHHPFPERTEENVINVLAYVAVNPQVSIRTLAAELGLSKSTVHRILKEHKYHPFKIHLVQSLRPGDLERRLNYIALLQEILDENPNFLNNILWSDESRFHNNGVVNKHNAHFWSSQNPHWVQETKFQTVWGINVWCGLFNGHLIGPYFYDGILTGQRYLHFLQNTLPELLEELPLVERQTIVWQQDGAPPHNSRSVTQHLNLIFPNGWIGNRGPIPWPARSPDLTPLDYFLWGYLKEIVYQVRSENLEHLKNRILDACQTITPTMITSACTRELQRRYEACVQSGGAQFEHL